MQLTALARGLAAKGHHPVVAAPPGSQVLDMARQAGVEAAPLPPGWLGRGGALRRLLGQGRFDLGHAHDAVSLGWLARADRGEPRLPIALSVGGAADDGARLLPRGAPVSRVGQFFAASEWSWSALVREGIEESRIAVNHTAIDLARFRPEVAPSPTPFKDDDFVVGWVGRLDRRSGIEVLLEAARKIRAGVPPPGESRIRVLIVGEGPGRVALQKAASEPGMDDAVVFTGWRDDVPGLMAAMDVYAHAATSGDGFPVPLREAMAVGVPVVATDLTGMREILDNGKHGLIAPAGDAAALALNIMRLRRDPVFAAQLGKAGQLKVQRYGIQAMVDRAEELYFRLIR
jgi:glycosyltransferase involved in cell wall biosynthesis